MRAEVITLRDPFNPGHRTVHPVARRRRIRALAPRTPLPHICYLNGRPILRAEWRRRVQHGDRVAFVVLPAGGGDGEGKNPMATVLSLALMVYAPTLAGSLYSAMGGTFVMANAGTMVTLISGAITFAGNSLISSAFAGRPSLPTPQAQASLSAPSPTYSMQAQGNLARIGGAIPEQFGRLSCYPDLAAQPYAEFAGNEQYIFQFMALGMGAYDVEQIYIEDTPISSFAEVEVEIVGPGEALTLFPASVTTSAEVSGQTTEYDTWLGPYVANAAGSIADKIAIDVVCPRGLYYYNDSGGLSPATITFTVEARPIDDDGVATGSYVTLGSETLTAATNTPQRYSFRYTGLSGRYEVRLKRTSTAGGTTRYGDELTWVGLRAYLPEATTWDDQTHIAVRMRASNSLSAQASRKIRVLATRKLPVWDAASGSWTAPQITRSPAWAMASVLKTAGVPDARIDIDQLVTLAATCASRGDTFDGRFDQAVVAWEALQKIGQAVRTKPYQQGGIVHFVRDQAATVPVAMYTAHNIRPGSLNIDYLMPTAETADSIKVRYFDGTVWAWRSVDATLPSGTTDQPLTVDLFGVTSREQAYREGLYMAAVNRYRRKLIKFSTEMEGFIPTLGDLIVIAHDMPAWGTSGSVLDYDAGTKTLTLSEPVSFGAGTHYIGLRSRDGSVAGPYVVTVGATVYEVIHTAASLDIAIDTDGSRENTHFAFGAGELWRQPARVLAVRPRGLEEVEIEAINEDDSVHTADEEVTAPAAQYSALPNLFTRPVVSGLTARSMVDDPTMALVSWASAPGARYYLVDVSNGDDTWSRVTETSANNASVPATYGAATLIRVAAVGLTVGPSVQIAYATVSDYMWSPTDTDLMWSATDTDLMWS